MASITFVSSIVTPSAIGSATRPDVASLSRGAAMIGNSTSPPQPRFRNRGHAMIAL